MFMGDHLSRLHEHQPGTQAAGTTIAIGVGASRVPQQVGEPVSEGAAQASTTQERPDQGREDMTRAHGDGRWCMNRNWPVRIPPR